MFGDEGSGRQIEGQAAIHLLVEGKVEVLERLLGVAKLCLFLTTLQQSVAATSEFVGDQAGDQVDGCHRFHLGLMETSLDDGGHATEP